MLPQKIEGWADAAMEVARRALWFPVAVLTLHIVVSLYFFAYDVVPLLDIPMHLIGGIAIAYLFNESIETLSRRRLIDRPDRPARIRLLVILVCAAAAAWEIVEYTSDRTLGTRTQQGAPDTLIDMLFGIVGGAAFVLHRLARPRTQPLAPAESGTPQGTVEPVE